MKRSGRIDRVIELNYFNKDGVKMAVCKLNDVTGQNISYEKVLKNLNPSSEGLYLPADIMSAYLGG